MISYSFGKPADENSLNAGGKLLAVWKISNCKNIVSHAYDEFILYGWQSHFLCVLLGFWIARTYHCRISRKIFFSSAIGYTNRLLWNWVQWPKVQFMAHKVLRSVAKYFRLGKYGNKTIMHIFCKLGHKGNLLKGILLASDEMNCHIA